MFKKRTKAAKNELIALDDIPAAIQAIPEGERRAIEVVDLLIGQAIFHRASDVHIEAKRAGLMVKYRIDGMLTVVALLHRSDTSPILSRLKVLSRLVIYQKDAPQDGRFEFPLNDRTYQFRISFVPTLHGEKAVARLAEPVDRPLKLEELGMSEDMLKRVRRLLAAREGVILLTAPTSHGKTSSMYAMLLWIYEDAGEAVNIATLEDPVEMDLGDITQTPIPPSGEMSYADGLKALLRQDLNVLMIGEVRDVETAQIAVQAGLTGHLVITTIHTGRASSVYTRLLNMGIEPFLVASAVRGTLAQRLVRRLCPKCRTPQSVNAATRRRLGLPPKTTLYEAAGCEACGGVGYRGRTGVFELLEAHSSIQELVLRKASDFELAACAQTVMPGDLRADGMAKAADGTTSLAEVCRVLGGEFSIDLDVEGKTTSQITTQFDG